MRSTYYHRMIRQFVVSVVLFGLCTSFYGSTFYTSTAVGQENATPASPDDDPQTLIRAAYAKTKDAKTIVDYSEIIDICNEAREADLTTEVDDYVKKLLAWTHNRRGELYAEQASTFMQAGDADAAKNSDKAALIEFEQAVQLNPEYWKALHNRGVSRGLEGKLEEAVADFSRTLELKADYANAWFNRGELYYELGDYAKAVSDYTQSLRLKPNDPDGYIHRGHAQFQLKKFREALTDYNQAVQLAPSNAEAVANRADAYRSLGQWSRAAADYRSATRLDPNNSRAMQGAAWLMATCPDSRYRDSRSAIAAAQRAIELLGEKDYRYLDTLAAAYASGGQFDEAIRTLNEALESTPEEDSAALKSRLALYQKNQPYREGT